MKLEKRADGEPEAPQEPRESGKKKPVVVYIMILFIAAFLLMAASFFMHQRSNNEVLGQLQNSMSALKEVQAMQDQNVKLQQELTDAQKKAEELESQAADSDKTRADLENRLAAMESLYTLQQQYAAGDYDGCRQTLQNMQDSGQDTLLSDKSPVAGVTSPADRYQQLKEAVLAK